MTLLVALSDPPIRLEPFADHHVEPLRAACAEDRDIWDIYPFSMLGEHFDRSLAMLAASPAFHRFAVLDGDRLVGMTQFIDRDPVAGVVEIGGTYIVPSRRGGDFNRRMKVLMIDHCFACGMSAIELRVDTRNGRSIRAIEKLGAVLVETLRANMTTWTGHVRDTAIYRLSRAEWARHRF